jgi:hypothetical protein
VDAGSRQSVRHEGAVLRGLRGGDRAPAVIAVSPSIAAAPDAQVLPYSAPGSRSTPRVTSRRAGARHRQAAQGPTNKGGTSAETPLSQSGTAAYALFEDGESKKHLAPRGPRAGSESLDACEPRTGVPRLANHVAGAVWADATSMASCRQGTTACPLTRRREAVSRRRRRRLKTDLPVFDVSIFVLNTPLAASFGR